MSELSPAASFEPYPLPSNELSGLDAPVSRRWLLRAGATLAGLGVAGKVLHEVDQLATILEFPPRGASIETFESERTKPDNAHILVFGGYSQEDGHEPALDLFETIGETNTVFSVNYPTYAFGVSELATTLDKLFRERSMKTLRLVGVSTGLPIGLMTLNHVREQRNDEIRKGGDPHKLAMPKIELVAGYSSPSCLADAFQGAAGAKVIRLLDQFNIHGTLGLKGLYSALDSPTDRQHALQLATDFALHRLNPADLAYLKDTYNQTFCVGDYGKVSPATALSQLQMLRIFNFSEQYRDYIGLFPPDLLFALTGTARSDDTVKIESAYNGYAHSLPLVSSPESVMALLPTNGGHADIGRSTLALCAFTERQQEIGERRIA